MRKGGGGEWRDWREYDNVAPRVLSALTRNHFGLIALLDFRHIITVYSINRVGLSYLSSVI